MAAQPLLGTVPRGPREPRVLDDFLQLRQGQLTQAASPHEHRRMPVEVCGGEEWRRLVLDQSLLLGLVRNPEHDDISVTLAAVRVDGVGSRISFEGRFYRIQEADIGPKPVRPDGPRLMSGAGSIVAAERAGRLGVGLTLVIFDWDTIRETIETFRTAAAAAGHDPTRCRSCF